MVWTCEDDNERRNELNSITSIHLLLFHSEALPHLARVRGPGWFVRVAVVGIEEVGLVSIPSVQGHLPRGLLPLGSFSVANDGGDFLGVFHEEVVLDHEAVVITAVQNVHDGDAVVLEGYNVALFFEALSDLRGAEDEVRGAKRRVSIMCLL